MSSRLNPYLNFDGTAREALEFYAEVLGGDLTLMTFGQLGDPDAPGADLIMHGQLETPAGFTLMGADAPPGTTYQPAGGMTVSLSGDDVEDLRKYWEQLSADGMITVPFTKQAWGDEFGMCIDRYGTPWMVNINQR